ncbi:MAG: hypothetical protein ACPLTR_10440, partial [Thermacetogeniaceae bacterium]
NVESEALIAGNMGGIYAGGSVYLKGGITAGGGEIKAADDVYLLGSLNSWYGKIWAGDEVHDPWLQLSKVKVYEHCGANIPGFPLPKFPVVDKGSVWCNQVKSEALDKGHYFESKEEFLDSQIQWNPQLLQLPWPFDDFYIVNTEPCMELSGIYFVDGPLVLNLVTLQQAYDRWKEVFREQHPGEEIFQDDLAPSGFPEEIADFVNNLLRPVVLEINVGEEGATIVADEITIDESIEGIFGVNTLGINGPFGVFAVAGDVVYRALVGSDGRLSAISTGKFDCRTEGNLNLDWVAAKGDVVVDAIVDLNAAQAAVPPGIPVGYQVVSWE